MTSAITLATLTSDAIVGLELFAAADDAPAPPCGFGELKRAATPWRPRPREPIESRSTSDAVLSPGQFPAAGDSAPCGFGDLNRRAATPWKPRPRKPREDSPDDSTASTCSSDCLSLGSRTSSVTSEMSTASDTSSSQQGSSLRLGSRTSSVTSQMSTASDKQVDIQYVEEDGRVEIIEVERIDYSGLADWKEESMKLRQNYRSACRQKEENRRFGERVNHNQSFCYELSRLAFKAGASKTLGMPHGRKYQPYQDQPHQQRHGAAVS